MAAAGIMTAYSAHGSHHSYRQQQLAEYAPMSQEPRTHAPNPVNVNPYPHHSPLPRQHAHHSSPSTSWRDGRTVGDALRPSLPPISNLLGIADGERTLIKSADSPPPSRPFNDRIPVHPGRSPYTASHPPDRNPSPPSRPPWIDSVVVASKQMPDQVHGTFQNPTPFRYIPAGDRARSPSTLSNASTSSLPPHFTAVGASEPAEPRSDSIHCARGNPASVRQASSPVSSLSPTSSPYAVTSNGPIRYQASSYPSPGGEPASPEDYQQRAPPPNFPAHAVAAPVATVPQPQQQQQQQQRPQQQQPLPDNTAAAAAAAAAASATAQQRPTSNPWQHHHYIATSAQATFPPSQDRYICTTCGKAFSRPSSLKIHSHSHTGEKPFCCPHIGCGKAFSVRSNMKRHERGCHSPAGIVSAADVNMTDAPAMR